MSLLYSLSTVNFGFYFINTDSCSLSHKLVNITASVLPISKPSLCTYHKPLHLKCTLLTAKFSSFFIALRNVSGGLIYSYNLLRAISTASLSGTLLYKFLTSREIKITSEFNFVSPRSPRLFECSFLCLLLRLYQIILSMFYLGGHLSYQVKKRREEVCALFVYFS